MKYIGVVLILMLVFTFGCAPTVIEGRRIDASKVSTLALDQPKNTVISTFGDPLKTETMSSGETKYIYHYYYNNPHWWTADEVVRQDMEILLKNDMVQSFRYKGVGTDYITTQPDWPPKMR